MAQSPAAFFCAADPTADGHRGATGFRGFGDFSVDLLLHTGYGGGGENLLPTYVLCHVSRCNPTPDKDLRDKLKKECAGVFNHALVGLKRLALNQAFTQTKSV